ncbi:MAG: U32 family peptidase C-terminal domain-containing protein, partial [Alphaproteobacteria bacterium]|nr:U32 family peptidase C-terminal domain-containing protein [Alphaproteobacteria bacterium]
GGAQTYESTRSESGYRTIGVITDHRKDGLILEVRNTINTGENISLLSPKRFEEYVLKMDTLIDAETNEEKERFSAGQKQAIFISEKILPENWQEVFPVLTVARKKL